MRYLLLFFALFFVGCEVGTKTDDKTNSEPTEDFEGNEDPNNVRMMRYGTQAADYQVDKVRVTLDYNELNGAIIHHYYVIDDRVACVTLYKNGKLITEYWQRGLVENYKVGDTVNGYKPPQPSADIQITSGASYIYTNPSGTLTD